jgi:hypothetical protein
MDLVHGIMQTVLIILEIGLIIKNMDGVYISLLNHNKNIKDNGLMVIDKGKEFLLIFLEINMMDN